MIQTIKTKNCCNSALGTVRDSECHLSMRSKKKTITSFPECDGDWWLQKKIFLSLRHARCSAPEWDVVTFTSDSQMVWPRETENANATNGQHQWSLREGLQKFIALCSQLSQNKIFQTETSGWEKNTTAHGNGWYNRGMFSHLDTHWELPRCLGKIQRRDGVRKARCWEVGIVPSHFGKVTDWLILQWMCL